MRNKKLVIVASIILSSVLISDASSGCIFGEGCIIRGDVGKAVSSFNPIPPVLAGRDGIFRGEVGKQADRLNSSAHKFQRDPIGYPLERAGELIMDVCSGPVRAYELELQNQASGRWKALPFPLIEYLQGEYSSVNLASVRYAENIRTVDGSAHTFGNRIYFPSGLDLTNFGDLHWMLHELEHTVQYASRGGKSTMLCEYQAKFVGSGLDHDQIDMERAADRKADYLVKSAYRVMEQYALMPIDSGEQEEPGRRQQQVAIPMESSAPVGPWMGNFCYTPNGKIGPGPSMPIGAVCQAWGPGWRVYGRIGS
jgi:Domain of unknown function (DUF4157)